MKQSLLYLSPFDGFISSFGFFFGVSFWIEDDLWLQGQSNGIETQSEYVLMMLSSKLTLGRLADI